MNLKALIVVTENVGQWDTLVTSKLDTVTRFEWENDNLKENITQFGRCMKFLRTILETMHSNRLENKTQFQTHSSEKTKYNKSHSLFVLSKIFCNLNPKFFQCRKFLKKSATFFYKCTVYTIIDL